MISVVIPVYNGERYIRTAIESVLRQEVPTEIIIINDGSNDGTERIIQEFKDIHNVYYYNNEHNLGAAASRNKGVLLSKGEYVAFLDADDWWEDDKLKKQLAKLKREKAVICSTARELVDIHGKLTGKCIPVHEKITYRMLLFQNEINCSSVLLCRNVALEFPMEHEDCHEDYITWLKILKKYKFACAVNEPLLKYRWSNQGKSGNKIKSAFMTLKTYRRIGFGWIRTIGYFSCYALNGVRKYWRKW